MIERENERHLRWFVRCKFSQALSQKKRLKLVVVGTNVEDRPTDEEQRSKANRCRTETSNRKLKNG